jgi:alpha-glucosidase
VADTSRTDSPATDWWRHAVTYQIYIRSFADANGDGLGDVEGIRSRLGHLSRLGVDAIWINPWYPSPQADAGYDVADFRDIDPRFGTLDDARRLIDDAHAAGIRVLLDIVPNHTSDEHAWFQAALAAPPGSDERARYIFRDGGGPDGTLPPNDWTSEFGGPAWTRVVEADGTPGQWYLHLFDRKQPDVNWEHPGVVAEYLDVLRFWFDLGADGFRIDVANGLLKAHGLPDLGDAFRARPGELPASGHPHWDQPDVPQVYEAWRALADRYDPPRVFVAEAWLPSVERLAEYLRPERLHTAFDFHITRCAWSSEQFRRAITEALDAHATVGAPVTWVLSNHDVLRHVSRYGRGPEAHPLLAQPQLPIDLELGRRRARAALLLLLALPGAVYLYQGEELGLDEVEDLPAEVRDDPVFHRTGGARLGRDGCRVPLPWLPDGPSLGFGTAPPWLPQPARWASLAATVQEGDPDSMLTLYQRALQARRGIRSPAVQELTWLDLGPGVLAFDRPGALTCVVNVDGAPVTLPAGEVVLASEPLVDGQLPRDAAAWITAERCDVCGFTWDEVDDAEVADRLAQAAGGISRVLRGGSSSLSAHADTATWSPLEYAAHVRDVLLNLRERIILGAVEDNPVPKPMFGQARITMGMYAADRPDVLATEVELAAGLLARTLATLTAEQLDRPIFYGWPREATRTLRWVGAQALHEAEHHRADIERSAG